MGDYPETITIEPGSDEYNFLTSHSGLIYELRDFGPNIELSADLLFMGDQKKWHTFVDVFFPEMSVNKYFGFKNGKIFVLPSRGTKENLKDMLDFFLVRQRPENRSTAEEIEEEVLEFAREQAKKQINAPRNEAPRGVGAPQAAQAVAVAAENNGLGWGNNNWGNNGLGNNDWANEGENGGNNVQLGQREENEPYLARLRPQNRARFVNERRRSNRRTRRSKSRRMRSRRNTRRTNRK